MRRILLMLAFCATGMLAFGQGNVAVLTYAKDAYVRFSNTVTRAWCGGNSPVTWGLYYGADPSRYDKLIASPSFGFSTNPIFEGTILATSSGGTSTRTIPDMNPGQTAYFQLKVWSAGYASYEAALASGDPGVLVSKQILQASQTLVATAGIPAPPLPLVVKWNPGSSNLASAMIVEIVPASELNTGADLGSVPEPSAIALAIFGLVGFIFIRRRKQVI